MEAEDSILALVGARHRPPSKDGELFGVQPKDRSKLKCISYYVMIQCILVFIGVGIVLKCFWKPSNGIFELDILARIMYLYDTDACGTTTSLKQFKDLYLNNETYGLAILPIRHEPVVLKVVTKLTGKTRTYMKVSLALHILWISAALILRVFAFVRDLHVLKIILMIFLFISSLAATFDFCLAVVYMAHIQQSLTKAMIIRYSGWGMVPRKIQDPEEFGGWVPLMASAAWLRGGVFFFVNIYICRFIKRVIRNIRGKEVKSRFSTLCNMPFPEANYNEKVNQDSLYFRAGDDNKL